MDFFRLFEYAFMQRAFLAGSFVAIACAALGLFLVLRKMSLIGDGLSHVSFGAIALGLVFGVYPLYLAVPLVALASLLILKISEKAKVYGDAAIGIVSAVGISTGVMLASVSGGFNVDLFSYLFGNILSIGAGEVWLSVVLSLVVLGVIAYFYWDLFSTTFDESYATASGIKSQLMNALLAVLTGITVVLCVNVVGIMLISALLILPAVTALQLSKRFKTAIIMACAIALLSVWIGISISFAFNLPTGATIVLLNAVLFGVAGLAKGL